MRTLGAGVFFAGFWGAWSLADRAINTGQGAAAGRVGRVLTVIAAVGFVIAWFFGGSVLTTAAP